MDFDIVAIGELLIDFTPIKNENSERPAYEQNPGGAPANVLVSAVRSGSSGAIISAVGEDFFGEFLKDVMLDKNIDCSGIQFVPYATTTMAFVSLDKNGERSFCFSRKPGADMMIKKENIPEELLNKCKIFHFGSISLSAEDSREATYFAVQKAKKAGAVISFDPNWRDKIWEDKENGLNQIKNAMKFAEVCKLSEEELFLITQNNSIEGGTELLLSDFQNLKLIIVTMGGDGSFYRFREKFGYVKSYSVNPVDTTGAGDAFWGQFLHSLAKNEKILSGDIEALENALLYANAAGAICTTGRGAIDSIPDFETIQKFIKNNL